MSGKVVVFDRGVKVYPPRRNGSYRSDRYRVVYPDRHGRRKSLWRHTWPQAKEAAQEAVRLLELLEQARPDAANRSRSVAELADVYMTVAPSADDWSVSHRQNQQSNFDRWIIPFIGPVPCSQLTAEHCTDLLREVRRSGIGSRPIGETLRAAVKFGVRRGYFDHNLMEGVPLEPRRSRTQGQAAVYVDPDDIPSTDHVERLAEAMGRLAGDDPAVHLEVRMAAYTGLRWGEQHELRTGDIDLARGVVAVDRQITYPDGSRHLHLPKYRKRRVTFVPSFLASDLEELMARRGVRLGDQTYCRDDGCREAVRPGDGPLLWAAPTGGWLNPTNRAKRLFRPACEEAGWPRDADGKWRWSWHSLRHHFCTWALARPDGPAPAGVPSGLGLEVADVSMFAGHQTAAFTWAAYVSARAGAVDRARAASLGETVGG